MSMVVVASRFYIPNGRKVMADPSTQGMIVQIPSAELITSKGEDYGGLMKRVIGKIESFVGQDSMGNYLYKIELTDDWLT